MAIHVYPTKCDCSTVLFTQVSLFQGKRDSKTKNTGIHVTKHNTKFNIAVITCMMLRLSVGD